jgi:hypothetical protein
MSYNHMMVSYIPANEMDTAMSAFWAYLEIYLRELKCDATSRRNKHLARKELAHTQTQYLLFDLCMRNSPSFQHEYWYFLISGTNELPSSPIVHEKLWDQSIYGMLSDTSCGEHYSWTWYSEEPHQPFAHGRVTGNTDKKIHWGLQVLFLKCTCEETIHAIDSQPHQKTAS